MNRRAQRTPVSGNHDQAEPFKKARQDTRLLAYRGKLLELIPRKHWSWFWKRDSSPRNAKTLCHEKNHGYGKELIQELLKAWEKVKLRFLTDCYALRRAARPSWQATRNWLPSQSQQLPLAPFADCPMHQVAATIGGVIPANAILIRIDLQNDYGPDRVMLE